MKLSSDKTGCFLLHPTGNWKLERKIKKLFLFVSKEKLREKRSRRKADGEGEHRTGDGGTKTILTLENGILQKSIISLQNKKTQILKNELYRINNANL